MDSPPTIDDELPAENTTIDGSIGQHFLPETEDARWEESTVAEKGASKKASGTPAGGAHAGNGAAPMAAGSAQASVAPSRPADDSARVLVDFDDSKIGPTSVEDNALSQMPTAISPNALIAQTRPAGVGAPAQGRLVVIGGNDRGREFVLTAAETTLGRGSDNDIILTDIAVSRHHITLLNDGSRYGLRDLSSGNGTLINGVRIVGDVFVHDGDQLELGNTLIRFEHPGSRSSVTSPPVGPPIGPQAMPARTPLPPMPMMGQPPGPPMPVMSGSIQPMGPPPPMSGLPLPPPSGAFVPVGAASLPPPYPPPMTNSFSVGSPAYSPLPTPFVPPPQGPSPAVMDLFRGQRKMLMYMGAGVLAFALVVGIAVWASSGSDKAHGVESTEAQASPALNALLENVDKPGAPAPAPAPAPTPPPEAVAPTPAPTPAPAPTPPPAKPVVASVDPRPTPAPIKKPEPARKPERKPEKKPERKPVAEKPEKSPGSAAEKSAAALYREKEFARASELLRNAADKESGNAAARLETIAKDYTNVGVAMAKGDANAQSNPTVALPAYQQALALDARSGKGAHGSYLKGQLAKVTPRAALAFMTAGKYEQARAACDAAGNYGIGSDPTIAKVRSMLEAKAKELYNQGVSLAKSKPDEAKGLWRRVLKMVPAESTWYTKSYAALNKSIKGPSQDEDE